MSRGQNVSGTKRLRDEIPGVKHPDPGCVQVYNLVSYNFILIFVKKNSLDKF